MLKLCVGFLLTWLDYVVDTLNNRIQWFDQATFSHTTGDVLAQPAPATGELKAPMGIAYDSANQVLFVTNSDYDRVELFSVDNSYRQATAQAYYGSYALDYGTTNANKFNNPAGLSIGQDNKLYVADTDNNRILSFEYPGGYTCTLLFSPQYNLYYFSDSRSGLCRPRICAVCSSEGDTMWLFRLRGKQRYSPSCKI